MMRSTRLMLLVATASIAFGACKKKPPLVTPPATRDTTPPSTPTRETPKTPTSTGDNGAELREKIAIARSSVLKTIYFDLDADELRDDSKSSLDEKIRILNANPQLRVRISGHCDDRGSDEYNIALGRRRSEMAKRYLTDRGVDASRIETATLGRERPAVQGTGEEAWSKNRRDEFEIIAGEIKNP